MGDSNGSSSGPGANSATGGGTSMTSGSSGGSVSKQQCTEIYGPHTLRLQPNSTDVAYAFEFLPLMEGERSARLTFSSTELGVYHYDLQLEASPAAPLPLERFSLSLGECQTKRYRFTNFNPVRGECTISFDHKAFSATNTV